MRTSSPQVTRSQVTRSGHEFFHMRSIRYTLTFVLLLCAGTLTYAAEDTEQLTLSDGDRPLLTYNAGYIPSPDPETPWFGRSGFIHPVYTPKGRVVTEPFPEDHPHQHGLMFPWVKSSYNGKKVDFWNSKKKLGKIEHAKTIEADADRIKVQLRHIATGKGEPVTVLDETWTITRVPHESMNVFDLVSEQRCATDKPLIIQKYHYGGMAVRGPSAWLEDCTMLTSNGKGREKGNHTRPNWVVQFGEVDNEVCGIAAMCHPRNFRAPQPVRLHPKKPYFCFAPMVLGEFQIEPDKPYISRFRFVAFDGEPDAEQLEALWKEYAK